MVELTTKEFGKLLEDNYSLILGMSRKMLRNFHDAEDNTQETMMKAFQYRHQFRGDSKFSTWLGRIAINQIRMKIRKRRIFCVGFPDLSEKAMEQILNRKDETPSAERQVIAKELAEIVFRDSRKATRDSFRAHVVEGWEDSELAAKEGISDNTIRARWLRAKRFAKVWMKGLGFVLLLALSVNAQIIREEVARVQVPVTVMDIQGRLIGGLKSGNFRVFEDNEEQEILTCSVEDAPVSVVIVFDNSGSMVNKTNLSRAALSKFVESSNSQDEYSLVTFNDTAQLMQNWTDAERLTEALLQSGQVPKGRTALLDALYLGVAQMKTAKYTRRAVILITDGGDNHSRYNEHDIKIAFKESDIQFYAIGLFNADQTRFFDPHYFPTQEEMMGPVLLGDLAGLTGGLAYSIAPNENGIVDGKALNDLAAHIGKAIRDEYILTYKPRLSRIHDGKYHKIKVKMISPKGMILIPYTRNGYKGSNQ
jgi:Ca-activated chloride channel family protein